ncbi:HAD family hydrolase [Lysobacter sp. A286]
MRYNTPRRRSAYVRLAPAGERRQFLSRKESIQTVATEMGMAYLIPVLEREVASELQVLSLYPDVMGVLSKLRSRGIRVAICSNVAAAYAPAIRKLLPGLDAYVLSCEVGVCKPAPVIYRAVTEALAVQPKHTLSIGDSPRADVEGPVAFGMKAALLNRSAVSRISLPPTKDLNPPAVMG